MSGGTPDPHLFVIFGGTGDLTARKLLPALYHLERRGMLGENWHVLGVSRSKEMNDESFRNWARKALDAAGLDHRQGWCERRLHYTSVGKGTQGDYQELAKRLVEIEKECGLPGNRVFYLSLPASAFAPTIRGLGEAGLASDPGWSRLVVEKPFGHDLASAQDLNETVHEHFREEQVFRIDHFLGKETVRNLMVFRFGNTIFEDLWSRDRIECVRITVSETLGVEDRATFYEKTGALRDVVQNHLAQVLSLVAMDVPVAFAADAISHEKLKVLRSIQPIDPARVVWGQYARGTVAGKEVPAYLDEPGVKPLSRTETYVAMRLHMGTWRWQGVPFFIRTGKRLDRKLTQIAVSFRRPPVCLFESMGSCLLHSNDLLITLQPDEGFSLHLDVKKPGEPLALERIPLRFKYSDAFGDLPDAYETLILDICAGNRTLFVHADEVEASWRLFDPLLAGARVLHPYAAGSAGPAAADRLLAQEGLRWSTE